jgi:GNAT superfamily N-acetyltransferase
MTPTPHLTHRLATLDDIPALTALMNLSIHDLQVDFLSAEEVEASYECMGLDTQLIKDQTYFVIELDGEMAGCGGWSYRETLFGANHSPGRDPAHVDPAVGPARIRAMYTHPDFARQGVGKLVIELCEAAARDYGFKSAEMAATLVGEKLYSYCGYEPLEYFDAVSSKGVKVPLIRMGRKL